MIDKPTEINEMVALIGKLNHYRDMYYNHDTSIISDREYDSLYDKLLKLEEETGVIFQNSPTQNVGYVTISKLKKVRHNHKLLSLDKTTDIKEFIKFFGDKRFIVMPKLDGLTCSLTYRDGRLYKAESRGDGEIGEDITHNAQAFINLPKEIPFKNEIIIDGECVILKEDFDAINYKQYKNDLPKFKNPRNLVSGTVRQLDNSIVADRNVRFIAWKMYYAEGMNYRSHWAALNWLQEYGFAIAAPQLIENGMTVYESMDCETLINNMREIYDKYGVPIDGMVGMFDDIQYGLSLGDTSHHPRHSLAFKFYPEENDMILRDIEWSTSRTGLINPVAIFNPIEIDGTTVSRATLNNVSVIKELQLGIGDQIVVIKANEIIPQITENLTRSNTYEIPKVCPSCGGKTTISNANGRATLRCDNPNCPDKLHDKIANFASREGMNIVGISEERLKTLINRGFVKDFKDLYHLKHHRDELIVLDGFGENSVDNILQAVEESRKCKLSNVIVSIGIPNIGKTTARTIAEYVEEQYNLSNGKNLLAEFLILTKLKWNWDVLPAIGKKTADEINKYVEDHRQEIEGLVNELEIEFVPYESNTLEFVDKTFCITGKLEHFANRRELVADIESRGGTVVSSVTGKTDYLINNDIHSESSKNKSAKKYGTKIITETDYILGNL